jgi:small conductance mechanosensitive channel
LISTVLSGFSCAKFETIIIPNGNIIGSNIVNYSVESTRRVDFTFGVDYDSDIKEVKVILSKIANDHPMIMEEPGIFVGLNNLGDSAMDFSLKVWVASENYWTVYYEIMESVKNALDEAQISIPYPHVQIKTNP